MEMSCNLPSPSRISGPEFSLRCTPSLSFLFHDDAAAATDQQHQVCSPHTPPIGGNERDEANSIDVGWDY